MATKSTKSSEVDILRVEHEKVQFLVRGSTPLILNRMSEKVLHELLMPKGRKNAAEKASSLKHDPLEEFRASPYIDPNPDGPTYLMHLASAFKGALRGAAIDLPGSSKAQIGRLTWVEGERVAIYGIPKIFMSVTRSADLGKTPDVRTRAIVPSWCATITVSYVRPNLKEQAVANLLASAGLTQGIGDWRPEKGSGTYGQFELVGADDEEAKFLMKHAGRAQQIAAMQDPEPYDEETGDLLQWFQTESKRRGFRVAA